MTNRWRLTKKKKKRNWLAETLRIHRKSRRRTEGKWKLSGSTEAGVVMLLFARSLLKKRCWSQWDFRLVKWRLKQKKMHLGHRESFSGILNSMVVWVLERRPCVLCWQIASWLPWRFYRGNCLFKEIGQALQKPPAYVQNKTRMPG